MKWRLSFFLVWAFLLAGLLLAGCAEKKSEPTKDTDSPLPASGTVVAVSSPLPTPSQSLPGWNAEPESGLAILRGRIEITGSTLLGELFLVKAVPTSDPDINLLELDEERSPRASIDRSTGEFIFLDIEPGRYGLIVWEPTSSSPVNDPVTGETLFLELQADQVTDVNTLYFP
jgi:hypothetical protein